MITPCKAPLHLLALAKAAFCVFLMVMFNDSSAQHKSSFWYFGENAGLQFNEDGIQVMFDGKLRTNEGCATISNTQGELLFYTDGITVWDRTHQVMPNGTGLLGHPSSTQSAIIVPKPNTNSIYYIFTVTNIGNPDGLRYSEVDLSLNNGLGAVTSNKNILLFTTCSEKITAVHQANGKDFWVISHAWNSNEFLVFSVTENGVDMVPRISAIGQYHGGDSNNSHGYMKVSPNGTKIAIAKWHENSFVELLDFDTRTGMITNPILLDSVFDNEGKSGAYGLEFSPNGRLLYVSDFNLASISSTLHQFDLAVNTKESITNSDTIIYSGANLLSALQLAADGKIYVSNSYTSHLDVIENPNVLGSGCTHRIKAIDLGGRLTVFGLPQFIQSYFVGRLEADNVCVGTTSVFNLDIDQPADKVTWELGDGQSLVTTEPDLDYLYESPGIYNVQASVQSGYNTYYLNKTIEIYDNPDIQMNPYWFICNKEPLTLYLKSSHDGYVWSTGETTDRITVSDAGRYSVTVFNDTSSPSIVCENTMDIEVYESGMASITHIEIKDWTATRNSIRIEVQGMGDYEYSLDQVTYQEDKVFHDLSPGDYTVYVRDRNGCGIIEEAVYIMNYPKYFTPNGDGYNDTWKITASDMEPDMTISIFDRYGKLIKQLSPSSMGWDGTYNGRLFPTSDYWFIVNRPSKNKQYKGHFTLKR